MTPNLSLAQLATLKAAIQADGALSAKPMNSDGHQEIADAMNLAAAPDYRIWRQSITIVEVMQNGFAWDRVDNMTVGQARIWDFMTRTGVVNPSLPNVRAGVLAAFVQASNAAMRTAIFGHFGRLATRVERLFVSGGTGAVSDDQGVGPATAAVYGTLTFQEVQAARELP